MCVCVFVPPSWASICKLFQVLYTYLSVHVILYVSNRRINGGHTDRRG